MLWLDEKRGFLGDWITQRWVQFTGTRVNLDNSPWLAGPTGGTRHIGRGALEETTCRGPLGLQTGNPPIRAFFPHFEQLRSPSFDPDKVVPEVRAFYEQTSAFELDAWSEWSGIFRPWGWLLAVMFSRRLQQLNLPLSSLDSCRGVTSEVFDITGPGTAEGCSTAWVRRLVGTGNILYAAAYGLCQIPTNDGPCSSGCVSPSERQCDRAYAAGYRGRRVVLGGLGREAIRRPRVLFHGAGRTWGGLGSVCAATTGDYPRLRSQGWATRGPPIGFMGALLSCGCTTGCAWRPNWSKNRKAQQCALEIHLVPLVPRLQEIHKKPTFFHAIPRIAGIIRVYHPKRRHLPMPKTTLGDVLQHLRNCLLRSSVPAI